MFRMFYIFYDLCHILQSFEKFCAHGMCVSANVNNGSFGNKAEEFLECILILLLIPFLIIAVVQT